MPSEELLAYLCQCTAKTFRGYVKTLCELHLTAKGTQYNATGTQSKSFYLMLPSNQWLIEREDEAILEWREKSNRNGELVGEGD